MLQTIFVGIPSYRDSECQHTIKDMLEKAKNPKLIRIGICFQYDFEHDLDCFQFWPEEYDQQIQIDRVRCEDATGPCFARYRVQEMWGGEMYYLAIDSHMRFVKHWDVFLIRMLEKCEVPEKAIITCYPPDYILPNEISKDPRGIMTCASHFGEDGMLRLTGKRLRSGIASPITSLFWVAGFAFSRSTVIQDAPYDPHLPHLFFGEENSMGARLWTAGYDFYSPGRNIVYHLWERIHRPNFRENIDHTDEERKSRERVKFILNMVETTNEDNLIDIETYGLKHERTIEEYYEFIGVDYRTQVITEKAKLGGLTEDCYLDNTIQLLMDMMSQN